jgi:hypothetical protein
MGVTYSARMQAREDGGYSGGDFSFNPPPNTNFSLLSNLKSIEIIRSKIYSKVLEDRDFGYIEKLIAEKIAEKYSVEIDSEGCFHKTIEEDRDFGEAFKNLDNAEKDLVSGLEHLLKYIDELFN